MSAASHRAGSDEGRRVLRNLASLGAFLLSPLVMLLMVRALGTDGYGRWWWTFVLLEAAAIVGMLGTDLYVRRELPRLGDGGEDGADTPEALVGSSLSLATAVGVAFAVLQYVLAGAIAAWRSDPALFVFLRLLSPLPILWNLGTAFGAALQSRHHLLALAVLRGVVVPILTCVVYLAAWRAALPIEQTLWLLLGLNAVGLALTAVLYARHFSLPATLRAALRPRHAARMARYGARLLPPLVLFTIGGKLDLYVLGAYAAPAAVGIYAACLQVASGVPNTRALFDPITQAQIGALHVDDSAALRASLRHLTKLCALGLALPFVITVSVGEPILGWLLGARAAVALPLSILTVGNWLAGIAIASWLVPMLFAGRPLTFIAAVALAIKSLLLFALVPRHGAVGAAIATAVGAVVAVLAQALLGGQRLRFWPFPRDVIPVLLVSAVAAAGGHALYRWSAPRFSPLAAVAIVGGGMTIVLGAVLLRWLDAADRAALKQFVGLRSKTDRPVAAG